MALSTPAATQATIVGPQWYGASAAGVWSGAQRAYFSRFQLHAGGTFRYINWTCAVQSGNFQVGVVALSGAGHATYSAPVMGVAVSACPAAGDIRTDCGATYLTAGDYAMFFWADNTTISVQRMTGLVPSLRLAGQVNSLASGVIAGGTLTFAGVAIAPSMTLEADV